MAIQKRCIRSLTNGMLLIWHKRGWFWASFKNAEHRQAGRESKLRFGMINFERVYVCVQNLGRNFRKWHTEIVIENSSDKFIHQLVDALTVLTQYSDIIIRLSSGVVQAKIQWNHVRISKIPVQIYPMNSVLIEINCGFPFLTFPSHDVLYSFLFEEECFHLKWKSQDFFLPVHLLEICAHPPMCVRARACLPRARRCTARGRGRGWTRGRWKLIWIWVLFGDIWVELGDSLCVAILGFTSWIRLLREKSKGYKKS